MIFLLFLKILLVFPIFLFADEVQNSVPTIHEKVTSSCQLINGIYQVDDIVIPLTAAKSREDCPKQINYDDSISKYNSVKTARCIVYSESKHGGCKKSVGYIETPYRGVEKISEGCSYFFNREEYIKEVPKIDFLAKKNKSDCASWNHARYGYQIERGSVDGLVECNPYISVGTKCLTDNDEIFEKKQDTLLNKVFLNGGLIWSTSLTKASSLQEAENFCQSKNAELPTQSDFKATPGLRSVIDFDAVWTKDEPFSIIRKYQKVAKRRQGYLVNPPGKPNYKMVKPENIEVICVKRI